MTEKQPEALRLADELLALHGPTDIDERAAAELRRLHTEGEAWKRWCQEAEERGAALEQAGRQALEALENSMRWPEVEQAIAALRERLAEPTGKQSLQVEQINGDTK